MWNINMKLGGIRVVVEKRLEVKQSFQRLKDKGDVESVHKGKRKMLSLSQTNL
jgi:hypothetical protein